MVRITIEDYTDSVRVAIRYTQQTDNPFLYDREMKMNNGNWRRLGKPAEASELMWEIAVLSRAGVESVRRD